MGRKNMSNHWAIRFSDEKFRESFVCRFFLSVGNNFGHGLFGTDLWLVLGPLHHQNMASCCLQVLFYVFCSFRKKGQKKSWLFHQSIIFCWHNNNNVWQKSGSAAINYRSNVFLWEKPFREMTSVSAQKLHRYYTCS